jgi:NAD(P)H-dependent FMN reductase
MINLKIIIASTRPGRKGPIVASWVYETAKKHSGVSVELLDLAEINLPFLDEPHHPRFKKYEKQHTKDWSAKIDSADAFIVVTSEYNHGYPAPIKNALDFLFHEWAYKPLAFVSYGGISGGTRAVQLLKPVIAGFNMMPIQEAVYLPFFTKHIDDHDKFVADETLQKSIEVMLVALARWGENMKGLRTT